MKLLDHRHRALSSSPVLRFVTDEDFDATIVRGLLLRSKDLAGALPGTWHAIGKRPHSEEGSKP